MVRNLLHVDLLGCAFVSVAGDQVLFSAGILGNVADSLGYPPHVSGVSGF